MDSLSKTFTKVFSGPGFCRHKNPSNPTRIMMFKLMRRVFCMKTFRASAP
jgi:hypothetical protein